MSWIDTGRDLINTDEIYRITETYGDPNHLRYRIFFRDGRDWEMDVKNFAREDLIRLIGIET